MDHEEYPEIKIEAGEDWISLSQEQFVSMANGTCMLFLQWIHVRS